MKVIFKKSHLPFLKPTLKNGSGRDLWNLVRIMQEEDGVQHQVPAEIMLLEKAANKNDPWAMCELARTYFNYCGDMFLPLALHYWVRAALQNDNGAIYDLNNLPIINKIWNYRSFDNNPYKAIEMKCALYTEMYLVRSWEKSWNFLDDYTKETRCRNLISIACQVFQIPQVNVEIISNLTFDGRLVDGLAGWDNKLTFRKEIFLDLERVIEVVFHELAHIVTFEIMRGTPLGVELKNKCGLSDERVTSWQEGKMGYEVITSEEDPDTLSYGVYTLWASFFLN